MSGSSDRGDHFTQQDSDLVVGVSVVQDHLTSLRDGEWDKLAHRMICGPSNHPVFKCSNILQTGVLMKRKKGGGVGTHVNKRARQSSHAREYGVCLQKTV